MSHLTIQYCSDLHLEFPKNEQFIRANPIHPVAPILVLAGDIVPLGSISRFNWFFDRLANEFEQVIWVPGNHEYYRENLDTYEHPLHREIRNNIALVNDTTINYEGVNFIAATLWSKISIQNAWMIERCMNDFHVIKTGRSRFSSVGANLLHRKSRAFIREELEKLNGCPVVVCSHHVPTFMNYPEQYKGDSLNEAFATELSPLIEKFGPYAWIFGHHHVNIPAFKIGKTQILTNQLGYIDRNEHARYSSEAYFEIDRNRTEKQ
ncbi:metallophosphoesterase [Sunxiuqinia indica]|uniref:metallophosphoesterase n=1 Tax=Sunxiuqinia indica TaxID=2692584 RepID=UPI0013588D72|nr:metallophosphoesterase [Sunxiuqinia indica]